MWVRLASCCTRPVGLNISTTQDGYCFSAGSHDLYEKPDLATYGFIVTTSSMRTAVASEYSELTIYGFVNISAP